jgi:zinc protease
VRTDRARLLSIVVAALAALPAAAQAPAIPDHPDKLVFTPIAFTPPRAADDRVVLKNGMVVFIAEDPTLPLVNVDITVRTGAYLTPPGKEGLASFTGAQIRRGGTRTLTAEQLDEKLDFLAANVSTSIQDTAAHASLNCLRDNLDDSLKVFVEMLKEPRFQEDRLALAKEQSLQEMKKRNDESEDVEAREWNVLLYGEEHFTNRFSTARSIQALTRQDLVDFHRKYFHPANMIAAVSGSFSRPVMIQKLEAAFAGWPGPVTVVPPVPSEIHTALPGIYRIQKDVNQGRVSIGLPSVRRGDPDFYALEVMNEILGGSGFTSRIMKTVRSDEGLAYSAGSELRPGIYYPGVFRAEFQSKSRSVSYALQLVLQEIKNIRESPVTAEEIDTIKRNLIESFPSTFGSKAQTVAIFAADEYTHRDPSFWAAYRDHVRAVTPADVQRVAQKYLPPDKLVVLVVGDQKEIDLGDGKHQTSLAALAQGRKIVTMPMRDPLTMKIP